MSKLGLFLISGFFITSLAQGSPWEDAIAPLDSFSGGDDELSVSRELLVNSPKTYLSAGVANDTIQNLKADASLNTRGPNDVRIYSMVSPAVVLIVTNDGLGSGSIIDDDGSILTNWHVIKGYSDVGVILKPDDEFADVRKSAVLTAKVVKFDQVADLALLKISQETEGRSSVQFGDLNGIFVGSDVQAIGHPTGESWTFTKGIVSKLRRQYTWQTSDSLQHQADVIQTQTPINPGNSGGPLLDVGGKLVGVNSFKAKGEALNFAVTIDEINRFLEMSGNRYAKSIEPEPVSEEECEVKSLGVQRSEKKDGQYEYVDLDCDGEADGRVFTPDDPSRFVVFSVDNSGDGEIDSVYVDQNRDGNINFAYFDTDADGEPNMVGYYRGDGSMEPYKMEPYPG